MKRIKLRNEIDKVLWEDWDPVGINNIEAARDEYRGYIFSIEKLLSEGVDISKLSKLLHQHANLNMGLTTRLEDHISVAEKLHLLM